MCLFILATMMPGLAGWVGFFWGSEVSGFQLAIPGASRPLAGSFVLPGVHQVQLAYLTNNVFTNCRCCLPLCHVGIPKLLHSCTTNKNDTTANNVPATLSKEVR